MPDLGLPAQPTSLAESTRVVGRIGTLLLGAGTATYRVQRAMQRAAAGVGLDAVNAQVALTTVVLTGRSGPEHHTEVVSTPRLGVNADRMDRLERLVRDLPPSTTAPGLAQQVEEIEARAPIHGRPLVVAGIALASAAFAALNHGGVYECVAAGCAGAGGQAVRAVLHRRHVNVLATVTLTALVAASLYVLALRLLDLLTATTHSPSAGYISAVLFLVPGFPLVTGALDFVKMEYVSGVTRLAYASVLLLSAAIGLLIVSSAADLSPQTAPSASGVELVRLVLLGIASAAGVLGFAVLFNCPWHVAWLAVVAGTVGNVVRLALRDSGVELTIATLVGALVVGLVSAGIARQSGTPRIALTIPGAIVMIPGTTAYTTLERIAAGEILPALDSGIVTFFGVGAIAVGLGVARMVTDREWGLDV